MGNEETQRPPDYRCDILGLLSVGITEVKVWVLEAGEAVPEIEPQDMLNVRGNPDGRRIAMVSRKGGSDGEGIQDSADDA